MENIDKNLKSEIKYQFFIKSLHYRSSLWFLNISITWESIKNTNSSASPWPTGAETRGGGRGGQSVWNKPLQMILINTEVWEPLAQSIKK